MMGLVWLTGLIMLISSIGGLISVFGNGAIAIKLVLIATILLSLFKIVDGSARVSSNLPQLQLTKTGITFKGVFGGRFYAWNDVGVFSVSVQHIKFNKFIYLVAYSDITHDDISDGDNVTTADFSDADILIHLHPFKEGRNIQEARKLAVTFNEWREQYGTPENNALHLSEYEKSNIKSAISLKRMRYVAYLGGVVAILMLLERCANS